MKYFIESLVKTSCLVFITLVTCVISTGCTSEKVETQVEQADKCTREKDMETFSMNAYTIRCPEANYRCIDGVYALQCFKLEDN